jgi:hypothetical protein
MFAKNKYTKIYYNIITRAISRKLTGYYESHHIIPKSLGGDDSETNLVSLTAREHFLCHLLLRKMTTGIDKSKMSQAAWMMASCVGKNQERYKINNRLYEKLKVEMSLVKKSIVTWNKGVTPKDETRLKLRAASISKLVESGKITQEEADYRNSLPLQEIKRYNKRKPKEPKVLKGRSKGGWKWSAEDKAKLSAQRMGRTPWNKGRKNAAIQAMHSGHDSDIT